jgi:hypothetical protein
VHLSLHLRGWGQKNTEAEIVYLLSPLLSPHA